MHDELEDDRRVTYIGPRAFVAAFGVLCVTLLAVAYGAARITESIETGDGPPVAALVPWTAAPSNATPAPVLASAHVVARTISAKRAVAPSIPIVHARREPVIAAAAVTGAAASPLPIVVQVPKPARLPDASARTLLPRPAQAHANVPRAKVPVTPVSASKVTRPVSLAPNATDADALLVRGDPRALLSTGSGNALAPAAP